MDSDHDRAMNSKSGSLRRVQIESIGAPFYVESQTDLEVFRRERVWFVIRDINGAEILRAKHDEDLGMAIRVNWSPEITAAVWAAAVWALHPLT